MIDLLPCPFCGAAGEMAYTGHWERFFTVLCDDSLCGAEGPPKRTEEEAAKAWNARAK